MVRKLILIVTISLGATGFVGCGINDINSLTNINSISSQSVVNENVTLEDSEVRDLEESDYNSKVILEDIDTRYTLKDINDKKVLYDEGYKSLSVYDEEADTAEKLITVLDEENYIKEFVINENYIVWIEGDEEAIVGEGYSPIVWQIVAKDFKSGETFIVDKTKYDKNNIALEGIEYYEPTDLFISDDNKVTFRGVDKRETDNRIVTTAMFYDLESKQLKEVARADKIGSESIFFPVCYGDIVCYEKGSNYQETGRSIYKENIAYMHNIKTGETKIISEDYNVNSINMYKNTIVMTAQYKNNEMADSILLYDINEDSLRELFFANSKIVNYLKDKGIKECKFFGIDIDDKYLYLRIQGDYSTVIYNLESNEFISIQNDIDKTMKNNLVKSYKSNYKQIKVVVAGYDIDDSIIEYNLK
ncbi:MAG: hypothetical protein Q4B63_01425 [Clostridium perfringens]|nr:hypothetical protein [Clostridium perfringens]